MDRAACTMDHGFKHDANAIEVKEGIEVVRLKRMSHKRNERLKHRIVRSVL